MMEAVLKYYKYTIIYKELLFYNIITKKGKKFKDYGLQITFLR